MILVVGTRRSGTSMWMQILRAAGFPVIGDTFPRDWARVADANPRGFYESTLRDGINFTTHPDPVTGARFDPAATRRTAVKVFHQGVPRTERVWLDRVLVTVRDWRGYCRSVLRLEAMERAARGEPLPERLRPDPAVEWLRENLLTLRDAATRGYPCRFVSYEALIEEPARVVLPVLDWIGEAREPAAAVHAVEPSLSTPETDTPPWVSPEHSLVYDAFCAAVRGRAPYSVFERMEALEAEAAGRPDRFAEIDEHQRAVFARRT